MHIANLQALCKTSSFSVWDGVMDETVLHALIVGGSLDPAVIPLSDQYELHLDPYHKTVRVERTAQHSGSQFNHRVRSLLTLYGENGCGKTDLMLRIAGTFAKFKNASRVGVLYYDSDAESLKLYKGDSLGGWSVSAPFTIAIARVPPTASSVFYSTSPFENRRRSFLARTNVRDVSPPFGRDLKFDGLSLLDIYEDIKGKAPFLGSLRILVKAKLPSVDAVIERAMRLFDETRHPNHRARTIRLQLRTWFSELGPLESEITAINLHMIVSALEPSLGSYFASATTNLIERIAESPEYEGTGNAFYALCERFVDDFRSHFRFTGRQVREYLRGQGRLLSKKIRAEIFASPEETARLVSPIERGSDGIARFASDVGLLEFRFKNLSSGEIAFLMLYAALASALPTLEHGGGNSPIFILLDEGEMFLHPKWQREYLANVLEFISRFPSVASRAHVIVSTHSLIIAADSPPNRLFDVQAGEVRNGFGLGPKALLADVYHVERFAGANASKLLDQIVQYLRDTESRDSAAVSALADELADQDLQSYVRRELERRVGRSND
jgi:energy-coupling factor transporter ATP-binding protein EcfA2